MGKDGSGAPKVTQQGHASMEGLFAPTMAPSPGALTHPHPKRVPTTVTPQPSLTTKAYCFPCGWGQRLIGEKFHWFRKLAHTSQNLFWLILLCSLRLTW